MATAAPSDASQLIQHCKLLVLQATAHQQLAGIGIDKGGGPGGSEGGGVHLTAALQGYEAVCGVGEGQAKEEEQGKLAETMAEAALKLAVLCSDLLQVRSSNFCKRQQRVREEKRGPTKANRSPS